MSAVDALRIGDLDQALADLQNEVRAAPDNPRHRVFLFQLLSVLGQWDRALTQLQVVRDLDPAAIPMVKTYQEVLRCEILRRGVFAGERTPLVLGDPAPWLAQMIEALRLTAQGDVAASQKLREQAFEMAPATAGTLTYSSEAGGETADIESPFEWLADADSRLGPLLEVILNGRYYWVPFERIAAIAITAPEDLRDLVWLPANFQWINEGQAVGLIPTRYPGSETSQDSQLRLGRRTEWQELAAGVYAGIGQRLLATDRGEFALMNLRRIEFARSAA